jgi:Gly-Xaa carboxypeptidase
MDEKMLIDMQPGLPQPVASPPPQPTKRSRWQPDWRALITTLVIMSFLFLVQQTHHFFFDVLFPYNSHSSHTVTSLKDQCPQVKPLFPGSGSSTEALLKMESYLGSPAFRNLSVAHMAGAIQIPTQSFDDMGEIGVDPRWDIMYEMAAYLARTFPLVHKTLTLEKVNTHGLLYTWAGSDENLKPTVLMAHQDVVPVAPETVSQWDHPPFSGAYDGKYVWGRGASDCKNTLIGILEAVELLVSAGFSPKRTLVLTFGFDEEISGARGAAKLAPVLVERYGKDGAAVVLDEGMGIVPLWGTTFAAPGVAEKGYIDVEVVVRMPGGHSSIPPDHSGIGVMSELISLIEAHPYSPRLHDENPYLGLMECGAAHSPDFPPKLKKLLGEAFSARTLSQQRQKKDQLAEEAAKAGPMVKYLFTTSVAVDVIAGGVKVNALPERTRALVNHRVNVGDTSKSVQEKLTPLARQVADKHNLTLHAFSSPSSSTSPFSDDGADNDAESPNSITLRANHIPLEPAPVTPTSPKDCGGKLTAYGILSGTTRGLYGESVVMAPGIMTGNTDTRFYWDLSHNIFRFVPMWDPDQNLFEGIHTINEKASMLGHVRGVQWFSKFIQNMDEADLA